MTSTGHNFEPESSSPQSPMKKQAVFYRVLAGIVILISGVVIGAGGTIIFGRELMIRSIFRHPHAPQLVAHLKRELDLSSDQANQVEEILSRHFEKIWQIRESIAPQMREELDNLKKEVAAVLDEKQREEWENRVNLFQKFMRPGFGKHGRSRENKWKDFDSDGDGRIMKEEVPDWMLPRFNLLDVNGDGAIDGEELKAATAAAEPRFPHRDWKLEKVNPRSRNE